MLQSKVDSGVRYSSTPYFLLRTSTLPLETVQDIIINKNAIPLPELYCEIIETVEFWGRLKHPRWPERVLLLFHRFLDLVHSFYDGPPTKDELFYESIYELMNLKHGRDRYFERVAHEWQYRYYCDWVAKKESFHKMVCHSLFFFEIRLSYLHENGLTPAVVPSIVPSIVQSSEED